MNLLLLDGQQHVLCPTVELLGRVHRHCRHGVLGGREEDVGLRLRFFIFELQKQYCQTRVQLRPNHPGDPKIVAIVDRYSLFRYEKKYKGDPKMVFVMGSWSLFRGGR